jgi:hypothetical protein
MKKLLAVCFLFLIFVGCRMTNESFVQKKYQYGEYCNDAKLVESVYSPYYMNLADILKYAKEKHGKDVSVSNVHYDVKESFFGSMRKSCIFDIVKCNE